jgi:hypothetical protein
MSKSLGCKQLAKLPLSILFFVKLLLNFASVNFLKQLLSISLLLLYLNSFTEFHELLRVPVLVEHYQEHRQKVSDISFWEFLVMHYKTDVAHDEQDNQLPFKDKNHSYTAPAISLPFHRLVLKEPSSVILIKHTSFYKVAHFASPNQAIFQPPKLS